MSEKEIKKANKIFTATMLGSVACGMAIALWNYWLGMAIAFVGAVCGLMYFKRATARERLSDEREEHIEGKAGSVSYRAALISGGVLLAILGGLESVGISLPAMAVFGPYFAFIAAFHVICYHHYERRFG
jgi:dipeptide/tripeptide permease